MNKYYFIRRASGVITGPFSAAKLAELAERGRLTADDQISADQKTWWYYEGDGRHLETMVVDAPAPNPPNAEENAPEPESDVAMPPVEEPVPEVVPEEGINWSGIISSVWISYRHYPKIAEHLKPLAWFAVAYALFACVIGWIVTPPVAFFSLRGLYYLGVGLASWGTISLLQLLECWGCFRLAKMPFQRNARAWGLVWTGMLRNATLYGTVILFHTLLFSWRMILLLPVGIMGIVCIWNEICHWKIMVRAFADGGSRKWAIGVVLHTVIFHTGLVLATFI